ncbi:MAG: bifunctional tetrahydrofolate synthase/dihydrofolate synthase [Pseudomonadota bacterium]|nr:bifunctional tetrahydrofolate synthase/dihydrofolate synthase [Pseudomonadota bacterium]MDO7666946.1 bifunctional tetrahydrofolate synthase/dihydrofolate synthase [Pseudomonadota bacterium]MDO7710704.1 bifunctional tetrahydrofolate synthase/dihydrofolate synthase [Pseudomonadota bacterium]
MRFQTLPQWLKWQESLHFTEVDPGLERVGQVWQQLGGISKLPFTVLTIAGTNGKGSSVAMLDSILRAAGYRTGTYTSPHLLQYNERICMDGKSCDDKTICETFDRIDKARDDISLTYFEFATLAAVDIFIRNKIDIAILEVGMGGRLDAVNIFDTDIALITPISLDHTAWLGTNREAIGFEKAGVIRRDKPVVCSEKIPPQSLISYSASLQSPTYLAGSEFNIVVNKDQWHWSNSHTQLKNLPFPALMGEYQLQNAAAVLQVISLLNHQGYVISESAVTRGLTTVTLAGRFQQIQGEITTILDVTHNQQGAENLAKLLVEIPCQGQTFSVLSMLKDKDVAAVASILKPVIDVWYVAGLEGSRGMTSETLAAQLSNIIDEDKIRPFSTVIEAYAQAMIDAKKGDRVLVFGSFHTVEAVLTRL